jgi:hypothetical protein
MVSSTSSPFSSAVDEIVPRSATANLETSRRTPEVVPSGPGQASKTSWINAAPRISTSKMARTIVVPGLMERSCPEG